LVKVSWSVTGKPASAILLPGLFTSTAGVEAVFCEAAERDSQESEATNTITNGLQRRAMRQQPAMNVDPSLAKKSQAPRKPGERTGSRRLDREGAKAL
jgi:hypothetical protein